MKERAERVWKTFNTFSMSEVDIDPKRMDDAVSLIIRQKPANEVRQYRKYLPLEIYRVNDIGEMEHISSIDNVSDINVCLSVINWDYQNYLRSSKWQSRRAEYFQINDCKCAICKSRQTVQLHHLNYDRLGYENDNDLIALCKDCHDKIHRMTDSYVDGIGDLEYVWYDNTRNISNANNNQDLIIRFITKFERALGAIFNNLPSINIKGGARMKFISVLRDTIKAKRHNRESLPFAMMVKLIK